MTEYSDESFSIHFNEGILICTWHQTEADFDYVDKVIRTRLALSEGKKFPCFSDIGKIKFSSHKAMKRLAEDDSKEGISALALLVKNKLQQTQISFFCMLNHHNFPLKVFTKEQEAFEWLKKFTNDNTI